MYCISKDNKGTILICLACPHTERVQDFDGNIGNQRTSAAHAMLKHVYVEHSRETHLRAMAMVNGATERAPIALPHFSRREGPEENLPLGHSLGRLSSPLGVSFMNHVQRQRKPVREFWEDHRPHRADSRRTPRPSKVYGENGIGQP